MNIILTIMIILTSILLIYIYKFKRKYGSNICINMFYSAKYWSFHILASFTSGYEHFKPVFNNSVPFLKQNIIITS